ncbi:hypothetical protein ES677_12335 [Bizionia gelidisalsuginis]|uniref:Uncharacterized protein n=1 Tax=Bizionia gelidisalsuginis TaxID=291188 RepID=A0ABY3M856_9FLAO|nr:hypothetical protein [Bizionia gelidisalsuginis]TYC09703.1 hypothetical protein ES677_12335 [Bizionia gelidisalsuginis]
MEYVESSEQQIPIPGDVDENWMIFHKNGKHEVMSLGEIHFGKWVYTKDDRTIRLSEEENYINQKTELINNQKLILSFTADSDFFKNGIKKITPIKTEKLTTINTNYAYNLPVYSLINHPHDKRNAQMQ